MGWFSSRKGRRKEKAGEISEGPHRSPGFEVVCRFLETEPAYAVLDLGASSTESVEFLSELCDDLIVQDVFHTKSTLKGVRADAFRFESADDVSLPGDRRFDVVLMWDLLHYLAPEDRGPFVARLAHCCEPNAMILLTASSIATIPPEPIHFKIQRRDRLDYVLSDDRTPSPGLTTREVEKVMAGFQPVRIFQLRNGLQEMVFQIADPPTGPLPRRRSESHGHEGQLTLDDIGAPPPEGPAEPVAEEPTAEEPAPKAPAAEEPAPEEPVAEEPAPEEPAPEEPAAEEPAPGEPAPEEPIAEAPVDDEASSEDSTAEEPDTGKPPAPKRRKGSRRRRRR